jgi:ribokinase
VAAPEQALRHHQVGGAPAVVLLGDINVDVILEIDDYPGVGGDAIARRQRLTLGGSATNTAVVAARLGNPARLVGRVGRDHLAHLARDLLVAESIDLSAVGTDDHEPTSMNIVAVTPDGERTMLAYRGANARLLPEQLTPTLFDGAGALHLSGYALLADPQRSAATLAAQRATSAGVPIVLDVPVAGAERAAGEILGLTADLAMMVVGRPELCILTGLDDVDAAATALLERGCQAVALKRGADGSTLYRAGRRVDVPGLRAPVVDTTGAGDAFAAALIHAVVHGWDDHEALVLANTVGALATTRSGGGPALPSRDEVLRTLTESWTTDPDHARAARHAAAAIGASDQTDRRP